MITQRSRTDQNTHSRDWYGWYNVSLSQLLGLFSHFAYLTLSVSDLLMRMCVALARHYCIVLHFLSEF